MIQAARALRRALWLHVANSFMRQKPRDCGFTVAAAAGAAGITAAVVLVLAVAALRYSKDASRFT